MYVKLSSVWNMAEIPVLAFTVTATIVEIIHLDLEIKISVIMFYYYICSGIEIILAKKVGILKSEL